MFSYTLWFFLNKVIFLYFQRQPIEVDIWWFVWSAPRVLNYFVLYLNTHNCGLFTFLVFGFCPGLNT